MGKNWFSIKAYVNYTSYWYIKKKEADTHEKGQMNNIDASIADNISYCNDMDYLI